MRRIARGAVLAGLALVLAGCSASTMPRMDPTSRPRPVAAGAATRPSPPVERPADSVRE